VSASTCLRCGRPTPDGVVCVAETAKASAQLAEIRDMLPAARDIATGQARHGSGGGSGKPGSRLPFDLGATARLDAIQNELTTWARHIAGERGSQFASTAFEGRGAPDPLAEACSWLGGQMEWLRHRDEVDEFLTDVDAAARVMRGLVRGPSEQRYLGPCGAPYWCDGLAPSRAAEPQCGAEIVHVGHQMDACHGDVYGRAGGDKGTCRTCGAHVDQGERRVWLDDVRRDWLFTAKDIADAYQLNVKTIRSWHNRGQLAAHGHDPDGAALHKIGEVLDLAAADAARREGDRATRARRSAARAATSEGEAA
jgi:hypothetical protein